MMLRAMANFLAPRGMNGRLSILIFHRVLPQADPLFPDEPDARRFDEVLSWVGRWFNVVALDDAVARLQAGNLPARALAITFDDGYADNATVALPIIRRHGMCATFFVATSFLDGGRMWNDTVIEAVRGFDGNTIDLRDDGLGIYPAATHAERRATIDALLAQTKYLGPTRLETVGRIAQRLRSALPGDLMMRADQVGELHRAGMQIGAHTMTHPILARVADDVALDEMNGSKRVLENIIDGPVTLFAYPNGKPEKDYLRRHTTLARQAGFVAAVSTAAGVALSSTDVFQLPRFSPWDRSRVRFGLRLVANLRNTQPQLALA